MDQSAKPSPSVRRALGSRSPTQQKRVVLFVALSFVLAVFGFLYWRRQALMSSMYARAQKGGSTNNKNHPPATTSVLQTLQHAATRFPEVKGNFALNISAGNDYPSIAEAFHQPQGTYHGVGYQQISSKSPRAFLLYDVISPEDCLALIAVAKEQIARSEVVHRVGESAINPVRTSYGMFIMNSVPADIRMRQHLADIIGVPLVNIEATQILRYLPGQYYRVHPDYFYSGATEHLARGGQRFATVLTWLNDVHLGGETRFPLASPPITVKQTGVGNSIMFYSTTQDGTVDPASSHEAIPPGEGSEKWVAVCWIRQREFH
ncbi:prolyl 4-hydroxylase alpha-1 subunit precursor, putative [Bodo saltans]|uniref:Prolyl 4-hydroxylase alpha-1 subunit, putative n=1 Tax=Bodo saltans TaxID=75058 RepID=A0A0S4IU26_BODSA|nr:prolyl 4-hydroxylase alpha-1 subunit precursor, putative [Bodo saltans]|eukprot:CUG08152.1 prolyl 4-hydroxylase alpha-1 subunit precursor, putative [Bodo saltans]